MTLECLAHPDIGPRVCRPHEAPPVLERAPDL
jgi:hypothetical protein